MNESHPSLFVFVAFLLEKRGHKRWRRCIVCCRGQKGQKILCRKNIIGRNYSQSSKSESK